MKIDPLSESSAANLLQQIRKQHSHKTQRTSHKPDAISISNDTRTLPDIAGKLRDKQEVREIVIKKYKDFVDKPLTISDQNILSALKNTMIT